MRYLLLFTLALTLAACTTTKPAGGASDTGITGTQERGTVRKITTANARDLTEYLTTVSGLTVRGTGANASITIRGIRSVNLTNEPLFVVDGTAAGHGLAGVYSAINVNEVDRVRVLKNASDLAAYGSRGSNGVIEIFTRK